MIAHAPAPVSLREAAQFAYERQQAELAERARVELENARRRLIVGAREELAHAFGNLTADPFSPYRLADFEDATLTILSTDDLLTTRDAVVGIEFAGERFEYRAEQGEPYAIFHVWTCSLCGEVWEPPLDTDRINSLADLGAWLAYAPTVHRCCGSPL